MLYQAWKKPCQAVETTNEQAYLQPTLNKGGGGASLTIFVTDCSYILVPKYNHNSTDYDITSFITSLITDLLLYNLTECLYFYKMKTFKISCRKVKISISPRGGNFQFSARGERHVHLKKISPWGDFTSPMCNIPLRLFSVSFKSSHLEVSYKKVRKTL